MNAVQGSQRLPSKEEMQKDIQAMREARSKGFVATDRHKTVYNWLTHMDEIASIVKCKPSPCKYLERRSSIMVKLG